MSRVKKLKNILFYIKESKVEFFIINVFSVVISILTLYQPQYIGEIVANFQNISANKVILLVSLFLIIFIISILKYYLSQRISERISYNARKKIYSKLLYTKIEKFNIFSSGEILSVITNDIKLLKDSLSNGIFDILGSLLLAVGSIVLLIKINLKLFIITIVLLFITILVSVLGTKFLKVLSMTQQESLSEFLNFTEKYLSKILLIKAFWLIDLSNKNFDIFSKKIYIDSLKTSKLMAIILPISNLLLQFCMLIVVMIAGIDVSKGIMSIADLTKFILYITLLTIPISTLVNAIISLGIAFVAEERIEGLLKTLNDKEKPNFNSIDKIENYDSSVVMNIDNIKFSYDKSNKNIFSGLSLKIYENKVNLIKGESGIGKTTLFMLLMNLYEVSSGNIYIYGNNIKNYNNDFLRTKLISYCPQESFEWGSNIYESLALDKDISTLEISKWITKFNLNSFISSLPYGLYTDIGKIISESSSGELQRLSIIRTILRNTKIILLDEPTANLDSKNEKIVNDILKDLSKEKTIVIISHKESTNSIADNVISIQGEKEL